MSLVQVVSKNLTAPGTTQTSAAIATTAQNVLAFVAVYKAVSAGVVTPSDSTGQTWIPAPGSPYSGGATGLTLAVWYAKNIAGNAANTFTFATTGADTPTFFVAEFVGRDQFSPFNIGVTASDTVSSSGAHTTGSLSATGGDDILAFNVSSALSQTYAATGLWAIPPNGTVTSASGYDAFVQYVNNANQGANPNTYSVTVADKLDALIISFKVPVLARSDEWMDYFDEVPEVYPIFNAYQQWDYPPQILDVETDWNDEGDWEAWLPYEGQSGPVVADNVTAATAQYYGEDAELADEALDQQAFPASFTQSDNFAPATIEESWDWFEQVDDDEWTFRDESNVQNPNVVATTAQPGDYDVWEDEDPDEFFADDFGNDDADLPQNDVWDHWPTEDDDYAVTDDFLNISNPGPLPITIEDGWDQEHFSTEDADAQWTEDVYENDPNSLLNPEDPWQWDEEPDQLDGTAHDLDLVGSNNNPEINVGDPWDNFPTADDDDYLIIDDYALVDLIVNQTLNLEDPTWWDEEPDQLDGTAHDLSPVGANLVIAPAPPPEDPWDHTQAEDDYAIPDDYAIVDIVASAQVPVDDAWFHWLTDDDDYVVTDDYIFVNNTPLVADDPWDFWSTDPDDETHYVLDAALGAPQPAAIEDPWDFTQDADDEEWIFRNADAVAPFIGLNSPSDEWDHFITEDDEYAIPDDYALINNVVAPSQQVTDDNFDWFTEAAEDNSQDYAVTDGPLIRSVYLLNPNFEVFVPPRSFTVIWNPNANF